MFISTSALPDGVFTATRGAARADFWRLPTSRTNFLLSSCSSSAAFPEDLNVVDLIQGHV